MNAERGGFGGLSCASDDLAALSCWIPILRGSMRSDTFSEDLNTYEEGKENRIVSYKNFIDAESTRAADLSRRRHEIKTNIV